MINILLNGFVMILDEIIKSNKEFAEEFDGVNCMDTRLNNGFLEQSIDISRRDAKIIKNAGNNVLDRDVIRYVAAAIFALGEDEIMVA